MSASRLIRWGGLALFLGGVLWGLQKVGWQLVIGNQDPRSYPQPEATILWLMGLVAALFVLLGLPALYARQAKQAGRLGFVAFVAVFVGMGLVTGIAYFGAFLQAGLVDLIVTVEEAGMTAQEPPEAAAGFVVALGLYMLGWLLISLSSLRAGVLPRLAPLLVLAGLLSGFLFMATGLSLLALPVTEAGIAWLGFALWREEGDALLQATPAGKAW